MAINSRHISAKDSMAEQLGEFVLEAGTNFASSSEEAVKRLMKFLTNKRVVDLGCGDGAATPHFQAVDVKVLGVDINGDKLQHNHTSWVQTDIISFLKEQPDNSMPNVFMHHALEHLPNPQTVLDLIAQKLAVDGLVYIEVPADDHLHGVHHSTFDNTEDITPPGLEVLEQHTGEGEHYIIARRPA